LFSYADTNLTFISPKNPVKVPRVDATCSYLDASFVDLMMHQSSLIAPEQSLNLFIAAIS